MMISAPKNKIAQLIDKVQGMVEENFPPNQSQPIKDFVPYFYQPMVPEDLLQHGDMLNLYGMVIDYWHFIAQYAPDQTKVRVYNPQFEENGWQTSHTIIGILIKDRPFLVDSLRLALNRQGLTVHLVTHFILKTSRDEQGQLLEWFPYNQDKGELSGQERQKAQYESFIHLEVDRQTEATVLKKIAAELAKVLNDVRVAVDDWQLMRQQMNAILQELQANTPPIEPNEINEVCEFLQWMQTNHFTFLGYREYELSFQNEVLELKRVPGTGLGILRDQNELAVTSKLAQQNEISSSFAQLPLQLRQLAFEPYLLLVNKSQTLSTIHRSAHIDYIGIKRFNQQGTVIGEYRFLGLFTSTAYHQRPLHTPLIRRKVKYVLEQAGYRRGSHKNQALLYILETYPRDELFQIEPEVLRETVMGILQLQQRQQPLRLFVRPDTYGRFFSCLVYMPRERFDTDIRKRLQVELLNAFGGTCIEFHVRLSESLLAQIHFLVYTPTGTSTECEIKDIENQLLEVICQWQDVLHNALLEHNGEEQGTRLFRRYQNAFSVSYREDFPARYAVYDIEKVETVLEHSLTSLPRAKTVPLDKVTPPTRAKRIAMTLYRPLEAVDHSLRFKLFHPQHHISLSEVLPMLENMGVQVMNERAYEVRTSDNPPVWIQDFGLRQKRTELPLEQTQTNDKTLLNIAQIRESFQDLFERVWQGEVENDGFNRLVLHAQLTWREIVVFRAYWKYLCQIGGSFSQKYVEQALVNNPPLTKALFALFEARCNPTAPQAQNSDFLVQHIENILDSVASLDEDRILRRFLGVILATLRTNYFQVDENGQPKPYLSFKFAPHKVPDLPEPRPMFEIFVYSPQVEGVHLRGGKVARGGLRWSDRMEDFRTEILGLVKAQMVKNAVIVPVGSKGGFVVKQLPTEAGRDAVQAAGIKCYQTFIRGLLDLTDNLVDGQIVPPPDTVRYDDNDPYLVVAADKGTATFSDIANAIAQEYHFWLDDAFASGGSAGYDHKKMGITAKGAWEAVKRHFRQLGLNTQTQDFTVIGIGDMAGDVFGNGMLLSEHIKLVGAFNHQHIFLDPNPEAKISFQERQRLFQLPRSTWADYDTRLLSEGGGVFPRSRKSIPLSPQVQTLLGIQADALPPNELIRAMLRAPVDLLWNGGIGTYVKATSEHNVEVGDRANDALRINGQDLRCKVVGEGGNLGFTQLGRIEYARQGGYIHTDAIDNSAGVDCSDHEVNIKILLNAIVANADMTSKQRNQLLADMTDAVAHLVIKDNYLQTQTLSIAQTLSPQLIDLHTRFIHHLEKQRQLVRALEFLPNDKELTKRRANHQGLTSPELCVLQAYSKITLYNALLNSDFSEEPDFETVLTNYFPAPLPQRFADPIAQHHLRREIIATVLTNLVVNRASSEFVYLLTEETGLMAPDIVRAFMVAWEIFDMSNLWAEIEALDNQVNAQVQIQMMIEARKQVERATRWLVRHHQLPLDIAKTITVLHPGVSQLAESLLNLIGSSDQDSIATRAQNLSQAGVPELLATRIASLETWLAALDIGEVAHTTTVALEKVAMVHFRLGTCLKLHWLRDQISNLPRDNRWTALSRSALRDELYRTHRQLTTVVLQSDTENLEPKAQIETWMALKTVRIERCLKVLAEIAHVEKPDLAMLSVALREIRNLL
jgi:glutamate dehydrogenase